MRSALTFPLVLLALYAPQTAAVRAEACVANQKWRPCLRLGQERVARIRQHHLAIQNYAFAWRTAQGLPSGRDTPNDVENVLIRVTDGAVLATLGGPLGDSRDAGQPL